MSKIFEEMDRLAEQKALQEQQTQEDEMTRPKCTANITSTDCHAKNGDECMTDVTTCQHREPPHRETRKENEGMKTTGLNFIEAVKAARNGKQIYREQLGCNRIFDLFHGQPYNGIVCELHFDHIIADDWEIVHEPPKTMNVHGGISTHEARKGHSTTL